MGNVPEESEVRWIFMVEEPLPERSADGVVARAKMSVVWAGETKLATR